MFRNRVLNSGHPSKYWPCRMTAWPLVSARAPNHHTTGALLSFILNFNSSNISIVQRTVYSYIIAAKIPLITNYMSAVCNTYLMYILSVITPIVNGNVATLTNFSSLVNLEVTMNNGLSHLRHQASVLKSHTKGTHFSEKKIIETKQFPLKKLHLKLSSLILLPLFLR